MAADALLAKTRVLLVEDDESNRYAMSRLLASFGLDVIQAESVEQAVHLLIPQPQFIVLDWMLQDGDAAQVMQHIREHKLGTKVLVVTVAHERRHEIAKLSPDGLLTKPFAPDALYRWFVDNGAALEEKD